MKSWIKLSIAGLAASLQLACGGSGGSDEEGVTPLSQLQPGERFAMETPLLAGGSQISHYVVHGVTPEGELVESDRPGLLHSVRVPILESVTRDGRSSTSVANPATLKQQQQAFYQQLWNATAEHEGTRDPQVILAEIDDLDARIVDLMDDVAASGVTLREYIAFYDRLDAIPELADKELAELNLREALSDVDRASVLKADPPACPAGLRRVVSQSGLFSYCRLPLTPKMALAAQPTVASNAFAAPPDEPSLRAMLNAFDTENDLTAQIIALAVDRIAWLDTAMKAGLEKLRELNERSAKLVSALEQNGQDDRQWRTYCAQNPELLCVSNDTPRFGAEMAQRTRFMLDSISTSSQLELIRLQSLISRQNADLEQATTLLKKITDARLGVIANMQ